MRIVIDTCVLVAGLRSRRGASFRILGMLGKGFFDVCLSVPLLLEYEATVKRQAKAMCLAHRDIDAVLDYMCMVGCHVIVSYLWRPCLKDPGDEMVLELAVAGSCSVIVTFNARDFAAAEQFGIAVLSPQAFLRKLGVSQ